MTVRAISNHKLHPYLSSILSLLGRISNLLESTRDRIQLPVVHTTPGLQTLLESADPLTVSSSILHPDKILPAPSMGKLFKGNVQSHRDSVSADSGGFTGSSAFGGTSEKSRSHEDVRSRSWVTPERAKKMVDRQTSTVSNFTEWSSVVDFVSDSKTFSTE